MLETFKAGIEMNTDGTVNASNAALWYLNELSSVVVAESGIPSDRYHLGKLLLRSFKDSPGLIIQIDGATDKKETSQSVLNRSVRCASSFRNIGLKYQDVIVIMAPNHLDLGIPIYAAFYLGLIVAGVDMNFGVYELRDTLKSTVPKIIFCDNSNVAVVEEALQLLNMSARIVTFEEKQNHSSESFTEFLDTYAGNTTVKDFRPADFDTKAAIALLTATSGSVGLPKAAALTHENILIGFPCTMSWCSKFPTPFNTGIVFSPLQWISASFQFIMSPIYKYTRIQTSAPVTTDHAYFLINKYRPEFTLTSPTFMTTLLKREERDKCDFTTFKLMVIGGSAVSKEVILEIQKVAPKMRIMLGYGLSEVAGIFTNPIYSPIGSVGVPMPHFQYKIVNTNTHEVIKEPNVPGELRVKGPSVFKGYYNNPEMTASAFDEEGWFKTGDILYRDEYYNFYFVDRMKTLLKYKNHQISPIELENVIRKHPAVLDVAVTGIPDPECGDLPVAVVIPRDGCNISAMEVENLVKKSLTDSKHLRGGVIFVKEFPLTSTSKVDRLKLKNLAVSMKTQ